MPAVTTAQLLKGQLTIWRSLALVQLAAVLPFPPLSLPWYADHLHLQYETCYVQTSGHATHHKKWPTGGVCGGEGGANA